jgi:hypothetical protein
VLAFAPNRKGRFWPIAAGHHFSKTDTRAAAFGESCPSIIALPDRAEQASTKLSDRLIVVQTVSDILGSRTRTKCVWRSEG